MADGSAVEFPREVAVQIARRFAIEDLNERATAEQQEWLAANTVAWLEALTALQRETEGTLAAARSAIKALAPKSGERATRDYILAKREHDRRTTRRQHFLKHVRSRRFEVAAMVGRMAPTPGALISGIARALDLMDEDEIEGAYDLLADILDSVEGIERSRRRAARRAEGA